MEQPPVAPEVDAAVADDDAAGAPAPPADIGAMLVVLTSEDLVQLGVSGPRFDAWHAKKLGSGQAEAAPPPPPPPRSRSLSPTGGRCSSSLASSVTSRLR